MEDLFKGHADGVEIIIASRYKETAVYHIQNLNTDDRKIKPFLLNQSNWPFLFPDSSYGFRQFPTVAFNCISCISPGLPINVEIHGLFLHILFQNIYSFLI